MKVLDVLVPLLLIVGGVNSAPTSAPDQDQLENELPVSNTKEEGPYQDHVLPDLPKPGDGELRPSFLAAEALANENERTEEKEGKLQDLSYVSVDNDVDVSEYSDAYPSWIPDGYFTSVNDADDGKTEEAILAGLETALVNEKLEPLYHSISHLKSLLLQLREKATADLENIAESVSDEESFYSSQGESYDASAMGNEKNPLNEMVVDRLGAVSEEQEQRFEDQPRQGNQEVPSKNISKATLKNNAVESAMNDVPRKHRETVHIEPGRRFKRDLGWGRRRGNARYGNVAEANADADILSSVFEDEVVDGDSQIESSWTSSSEAGENVIDVNELARKPLRFTERIRIRPREETNWRDVFLNLRGSLRAPLQRFDRRRRNKEDIRAFVNSMPTLEGLRKRTLPFDEEEDEEAVIPDPGPFYPQPPNLPPPDNVIRPVLPPDDTLPWELPPDFDEDNALLEEQTNGVEMINPFNKRYQYLRDVERSIMDESLQDLALELAGRNPLSPNEALRVRRVMQIPPPPPYGRKVVKSLYRKKAYGYPFMEDEFADELIPAAWESDDGESFDIPYSNGGGYDPQELQEPHSWGEYLQFGRIEGSDDEGSDMVSRLLSAIQTKEAKDKILQHLLSIKDASPEIQREILLQALMAEAGTTGDGGEENNVLPNQESESDESTQWGTFESNDKADDAEEAISEEQTENEPNHPAENNAASENTIADHDWESYVAGEDPGNQVPEEPEYFSEASESDASVQDWADIPDELQSNIPQLYEEMKEQILIKKLADFLQRTASKENQRI